METRLEQIAVKAVNQLPKSVVREIRTPRSVGAGGGRPPPATRWARSNPRPYRDPTAISWVNLISSGGALSMEKHLTKRAARPVRIGDAQQFHSRMLDLPVARCIGRSKETAGIAESGADGVHLFRRDKRDDRS